MAIQWRNGEQQQLIRELIDLLECIVQVMKIVENGEISQPLGQPLKS